MIGKTAHRFKYKKQKSRKKFILMWVVILLLIFGGFLFYQYQNSIFFTRKWRTNIALRTSPVVVISFPKSESDKLLFITMPDQVYVTVPYGYDSYLLESVWKLGELEKKPYLFNHTIEDILGMKIQGYVGFADSAPVNQENLDSITENIKQDLNWTQLIFHQLPTNLNLLDRCYLYWQLLTLKVIQTDLIDLKSQMSDAFIQNSQDKSANSLPDYDKIDTIIARQIEDLHVRNENLSVEINNTTKTANIGQKFARYVANIGGKVIAIKNGDPISQACKISIKNSVKNSTLAKFLQQEFDCQLQESEEMDAEIRIDLGEKIADRYLQKTSN